MAWTSYAADVLRRAAPMVPVFFCVDNYIGTVKLVGGRSMQPTFNARGKEHNDVVLLNRWSARQLAYCRGDVVVLRSPHQPDELMTKRVVGLPGDWVRPRADACNGQSSSQPVVVPRGHLWVEGDNEHASKDSNSFGPIAAGIVEARVSLKLWPIQEAGVVGRQELSRDRLVHRSRCESMASATHSHAGTLPWHLSMARPP
jgi:inner membrane protease subunit 2